MRVSEQHYRYGWDEPNRLVRARRYEREGGSSTWSLGARLRYRYDGANQRTAKEVNTPAGVGGAGGLRSAHERIAVYVFPGDFERRGLKPGTGFARMTIASRWRRRQQHMTGSVG